MIVPQAMHTHAERRARSAAAREADFDEHLADVRRRIFECLKPGGVFFASNAHGFGEDKEGWTDGRTPATRSWVCWLSEATWRRYCEAAGFTFLHSYYRGSSKAFLATVWRKP